MTETAERSSNIVLACVTEEEYEEFLAPNLTAESWPFEVRRVEPSRGVSGLIEEFNRTKAEVLMAVWEIPELPADLLKQAPSLRCHCQIGGAVRGFMPRELIEQGLIVTNWGDSISHTIAEHCLLQILAALRRATFWQFSMHQRGGYRNPDYPVRSLFDRRIGLHGLGAIAQKFVQIVQPFRCKLSAYSPHVPDEIFQQYGVARCESLEELFSQNEIIVELAGRTASTQGIVNEELLRMLPEGAVFVNSGRGAVVDEEALIKLVEEGHLHLGLDVFAKEPLPADSPLRGNENVFLTPHIAGPTADQLYVCGLHALQNASAYFRGEQLESRLTLTHYDCMT